MLNEFMSPISPMCIHNMTWVRCYCCFLFAWHFIMQPIQNVFHTHRHVCLLLLVLLTRARVFFCYFGGEYTQSEYLAWCVFVFVSILHEIYINHCNLIFEGWRARHTRSAANNPNAPGQKNRQSCAPPFPSTGRNGKPLLNALSVASPCGDSRRNSRTDKTEKWHMHALEFERIPIRAIAYPATMLCGKVHRLYGYGHKAIA